jgi:deferrochelatase/peroxidase EfeB
MTLTRRRLLAWAGLSAVGGAAAAVGADAAVDATAGGGAGPDARVAFHGAHQAGIATPAQDRLHFATFDLLDGTTRADLADLLRTWTAAAAAMCDNNPIGGEAANAIGQAPPDDTGETRDLAAARLTITAGFGTSLFDHRFGLARSRPQALADLPAFAGDALDPARSGGDLAIQACADDPQVAVHAVRNLARLAHGVAIVRYSQLGFGRTSATTTAQSTPRNMLGFKDGTNNIKLEDAAALQRHVWVDPSDGPSWMAGGSYLVARRIRMTIETWDRDILDDQEQVIGRHKLSGAPLGARDEHAAVDLGRLAPRAHVRLAHPDTNAGARLLRRGYSFVDGSDALGRLDAGLFFLAYQRDPRRQFTAIQQRLAGKHNDLLNEYITHVGSGLYAIPPGVRDARDWWGRALLS